MRKSTLFISALIMVAAIGVLRVKAQSTVSVNLTMWTTGTHTLWDASTTRFYGFSPGFSDPELPGPTIHVNEGDTVNLNVRNQSMGAPHTIHLHGLDVDQDNDGVPQTSWVLGHGEDSTYKFVATHAGTYLYHCHVASIVHVQMGMYGSVVVHAAGGVDEAWTGGPAYDKEYLWLFSEIDKSWHDTIPVHSTGDSTHMVFHVPPYEPDYFLVNGLSKHQLTDTNTTIKGKVGEKIYLRLSNIGFLMNEVVFPSSLDAEIISSDGRPLPSSEVSDTVRLTPGERYGVMLTPSAEINDSVRVQYVGLNNEDSVSTEWVPIDINGFIGVDPPGEDRLTWNAFPNPVMNDETLTVYWKGHIDQGVISIYDLTGRIVKEQFNLSTDEGRTPLDLAGLSPGIYMVGIVSNGRRYTKKIIVSR